MAKNITNFNAPVQEVLVYAHILMTYPITCMKLLASSIPGSESAKSVSNSFARPDIPAGGQTHNATEFIIQDLVAVSHEYEVQCTF